MKIFTKLKKRLTTALVLTVPGCKQGFVEYCYASRVGLSCILMKNEKVIDYSYR